MTWLARNKKVVAGIGVIGVATVAYLAFGVFGIHTAFIDDEVSEAGPVFDSGASVDGGSTVATDAPGVTDAPTSAEADTSETSDPAATEPPTTTPAATDPPAPETTLEPTPPTIVTLAAGQFVDRSYTGSGNALVLTDGSAQRFLRFEDFATDNGPDLFVYLTSARADADESAFGVDGEYVNLGPLTGNIGDQNYEIPPDVDLDRFSTVVVWCDRFSSAFTAADLS
jgi:hypothetical protein